MAILVVPTATSTARKLSLLFLFRVAQKMSLLYNHPRQKPSRDDWNLRRPRLVPVKYDTIQTANGHGVFVKNGSSLKCVLQKPTVQEMRDNSAVLPDGCALTDWYVPHQKNKE